MKISIRTKLTASFLAVTFAFILCLSIVSLVAQDLTTTIGQMQEVERKVELASHLQLLVNKLLQPANLYLVTGDIGERDNLDRMISEISVIIKELQKQQGDHEWQILADRVNQDILKLSEMLINVMFIDHPVGNKEAAKLIRKANLFSEGLIEESKKFDSLSGQQMIKMYEIAQSKGTRVRIAYYGTIGMAMLFLALLSFFLSRYINRPIQDLYRGVQLVASGELDHRLSIKTRDEIGELAREFNQMVEAVSDMKKDLDRRLEETWHLAITDALTGLYNHRFCMEKIVEEIRRADRYDRPLSIILADIDSFKHYNDTHGHLRGDDLLRLFGSVMKRQVRDADFVCRIGGEEFVMILPETEGAMAVQIAERLRMAIEQYPFPYQEAQPGGNLTISLGVASYIKGHMDSQKLLKSADDALYQAKREGKNKVVTLT